MLLQIDDKHRVTVDSSRQNFQLEQLTEIKNKKTDELRHDWLIIGYHGSSLRSVLLQYKKQALITDDSLVSVNDVLNRLNEVDETIEKVVKRENIKLVVKTDD